MLLRSLIDTHQVHFLKVFPFQERSLDPKSPAFVPSTFEFSSPKKADLSMTRYEAAKSRQRCKDKKLAMIYCRRINLLLLRLS